MITIIQITDCHLFKREDKQGYSGIAPFHSLKRVLQHAVSWASAQNTMASVLLLITGDISGDDSLESYTLFMSLMQEYADANGIAWAVIPGNHDNNIHFDNVLAAKHLKSHTPLTLGKWLIHGTDSRSTSSTKSAKGNVRASDITSIASHVAAKPLLNHALAVHHHLKASNSWMDNHSLSDAGLIEQLASNYSALKVIVHGHVHAPLRYTLGDFNTPVYGCPSTCWQWAMQSDFGVTNEVPGYQLIQLSDDGSVGVKVVRISD